MSSPLVQFSDWEYRHFAALGHTLGGPKVSRQLLQCNSVNVTFSDGKAEVVATDPITSIWKTITRGNISRDKFIPTLNELNMNVSYWSADMMKQDGFTVAAKVQQIPLAIASVREMGFNQPTRYDAICEWIKAHGALCQPEDGPQLRLKYLDQPLDEWLRVAMEAIRDSDGDLDIFSVGRSDGGLCLDSYCGRPDFLWSPDSRFVFNACEQPSDA